MAAEGLRLNDLEQFARLGILPELLDAAGVRRDSDAEPRELMHVAQTVADGSPLAPSAPAMDLAITALPLIVEETAARWSPELALTRPHVDTTVVQPPRAEELAGQPDTAH